MGGHVLVLKCFQACLNLGGWSPALEQLGGGGGEGAVVAGSCWICEGPGACYAEPADRFRTARVAKTGLKRTSSLRPQNPWIGPLHQLALPAHKTSNIRKK